MFGKWVKRTLIGGVIVVAAGTVVFGTDFVSYVKSSTKMARQNVKDNVPIEFELRRASDLLEDIIPEIQAQIRMIAQEEVEVAALTGDLSKGKKDLEEQELKIQKLRKALENQDESFTFGGKTYTRAQVMQDLAWKFERFKEAQIVVDSKKRLLAGREKTLETSRQLLEKTKSEKVVLATKIESLETQYRLIKSASVGSKVNIDNSKLVQTEKLIGQIKKRLDVAERVLAHETQFVDTIEIDTTSEKDLLETIDQHFANPESDKESQQL